MLKCIAVDDEPLALELLEDNISKVPYLQLIASFNNPIDALKTLQETPVDLIFLDIQMPGLTGLQMIQTISNKPMFILVTAYEKYALDGYDLNVVDYLVKPVSLDRFIKACNKAFEIFQLKNNQQATAKKEKPAYMFLNVDYSQVKVIFADILYIEGLKDYIKIHLKSSNRPLVARISIKAMEDILPSDEFLRVQKSYIVSNNSITSIRKNSVFIGDAEIPVGENYRGVMERIMGNR
jgi:two-component system LytT family response regulator